MSTLRITTLSNTAGTASTPVADVINGSARAWVNFNGTGTVAIRAAFNVSSITDNGVGDYTVNFTTALADANYFAAACAGDTSGGLGSIIGGAPFTTQTASALRLNVLNGSASAAADRTHVGVAIFR